MVERTYRGLLWSLVLIGASLDQVSKYTVFQWLYRNGEGGQREVIPGALRLRAQFAERDKSDDGVTTYRTESIANPDYALIGSGVGAGLNTVPPRGSAKPPRVNQGALFGFLANYGVLANTIFAVVSLVAALAIAYWSTRPSTARDRYLCAALGLILAGTLGNLYDRAVFSGVRDFLEFYLIDWPVFNVADCCLVCGAFLLLAQAFWNQPATAERPAYPVTLSPEAAEVR